jgi:molybdopterin-containing oxidoreductase family membrane subunit
MTFAYFVFDLAREVFRGGRAYKIWMGSLTLLIAFGIFSYYVQTKLGMLATTGVGEEVSWGIYIANFAYLIGIAAAAVMLVIPAYIFNRQDIRRVVVIGEAMAIAACSIAIMFILASLGRPDRLWHLLPLLGMINFPRSMLAWDVVVINSYLFLNIGMLFYILYTKYRDAEPHFTIYFMAVVIAIGLAISIHTVTAFLFSSNVSRPYWHSAIVGPRFLASAFTSGPGLIILALQVIKKKTAFRVDDSVIGTLAVVMTATLQINMFLLGVEMYTEFYSQTQHASSIEYLFFGLHGHNALVPWIWSSIFLNMVAVTVLSIHPLRRTRWLLNVACVMTIVGIWMEKGMGLVIAGFILTPLGDIVEYSPSFIEISVCIAIWAVGAMIFTMIVKMVIPVELGVLRRNSHAAGPDARTRLAVRTARS